jgi:hypothetical protein
VFLLTPEDALVNKSVFQCVHIVKLLNAWKVYFKPRIFMITQPMWGDVPLPVFLETSWLVVVLVIIRPQVFRELANYSIATDPYMYVTQLLG